jgi:methanogenic corrinoid protein MtbC1
MEEFDHISGGADPQGGRRSHQMDIDGADLEPSTRARETCQNTAALWKATLERVIQREVLPRLMRSHTPRREPKGAREQAQGLALREHLDDFVELLLSPDAQAALAYAKALRREGGADHSIFLELLAPAARRLGLLWDDDRCDFMEVTVGLQRLQQILRTLRPEGSGERTGAAARNRILLAPAPGETHVFGVAIVEKFFVDAGWDVRQASETTFVDELKRGWFHVAGFSLSQDSNGDRLAAAIAEARKHSVNADLRADLRSQNACGPRRWRPQAGRHCCPG